MTYRAQLNPFLKLIMKTLNSIDGRFSGVSLVSLVEEIITEAKSLSAISTSNLPQTLSTVNTLQMEHNQLKLNLK